MTEWNVGPGLREFVDDAEFHEFADAQSWSDGLPVIPPTPERVAAMLDGGGRKAEEIIGAIPPSFSPATVAMIAANAVMAGCRPEFFPVVISAVEAAVQPEFGLFSTLATTHPCGILVLVSGELATRLEINSAGGCMGPGFRANATIGRAVRLAMQNIGGSYPQVSDMATHGSPAKFTFCFAENAESNPWEPFHVAQGFPPGTSTVTVAAAEGPHNLNDHVSLKPEGLLLTFAHTIAVMGTNHAYVRDSDYFVVLCPEHAGVLSRADWTRADVQRFLFERARIPYGLWRQGGMFGMIPQPRYLDAADDELMLPLTIEPEDIRIVVAGGGGRHSVFIPTQAAVGKSVTVEIGTPVPKRRGTFVRRWGGWVGAAAGDVPVGANAESDATVMIGWSSDDITEALAEMAELLAADGYDLVVEQDAGRIAIAVVAGPESCAECLVPLPVFRGIVLHHLAEAGYPIDHDGIDVRYPSGL